MTTNGYAREVELNLARKQIRKSGRIDARGVCTAKACGGTGRVWRDGLDRRKKLDVMENKRAQVRTSRCPDEPGAAPGVDWERFSLRAGRWIPCPQCRGNHALGGGLLDQDCGPDDDRCLWLTWRRRRNRKRSATSSPTTEQAASLITEESELERKPAEAPTSTWPGMIRDKPTDPPPSPDPPNHQEAA